MRRAAGRGTGRKVAPARRGGAGAAARLVAAAALLALAGCAAPFPACRGPGLQPVLAAELLFGLSRPGGAAVSPAEWDRFVATSLTPRFPAGLTVTDAAGQWTAPDGRLVREGAKRVLVVAPRGAATLARLDAVRAEYRSAFAQQSVGLVLSQACASV